jgi:predicted phage terminase large subunit-like protein
MTNVASVEINNYLVSEGKEARANVAAPYVESGSVILMEGSWTGAFIDQLCSFPKSRHDEYVDLMGYICFHYFEPHKSDFWNQVYTKRNLV